MARIEIEFTPSYEDYLKTSMATTFNKPTLVILLLMGLMTIFTLFEIIFGWTNMDTTRLIFYVAPPMMFIIFLIYTPIKLRRQARQMADKRSQYQWRITSRGITVDENGARNKYSWETLSLAQEMDQYFIIFMKENRSKYIFMPKSALVNAEQDAQLRELLALNLGKLK